MSVKIQFLEFEIHLSDPVPLAMPDGTPAQLAPGDPLDHSPIYTPGQIVLDLQAHPPGAIISRTLADVIAGLPPYLEQAINRAPKAAATEFGGKVAYGTTGTATLPLIGPKDVKPAAPYIFSTWFTSENNFPQDVASFTRKSGGWFGIPLLFGNTTRYYWRGIFVYDAPLDAPGEPHKPVRPPMGVRRWIDPGFANMGSAPGNTAIVAQIDFSRDAGRHVDTLGFAMRGKSTIRTHTLTEHTTGAGSTSRSSWERLYIRPRRYGAGEIFWRCRGSVSNAAGAVLMMTSTGQIALYNVNNVSVFTLIGTTEVLPLKVWKKLDIVLAFGGGSPSGVIQLYLNSVPVLTATMPAATGLGQAQFHASSEIGTPSVDYTMELDIGFWMNSSIAAPGGVFDTNGLDFRNGSRPVLVRAKAASLGANWTGDYRTLCQFPWRDVGASTDGKWTSVTALAEMQLPMDTLSAIDTMPGSMGCVGLVVCHHGHKGTNNGQLAYKIGAAARVLATFGVGALPNEGGGDGSRSFASMLYTTDGVINTPIVPFPALELHRIKGNDAVLAGTDHLAAVAEIIGTFNDEDYPIEIEPALRNPLPYLGPHNAPYPRTPWARQSSPPISPIFIKAGTYVGNGTGQDLAFKSPVHWLWIRHITGSPQMGRWFSTMLGASIGGYKTPMPWIMPDALIDPGFVITPSGGAPTGVGALPDRSADVTSIVAANIGMLDGNENHKRDLLGIIIRELNRLYPADGNNWGYLVKTERDPDFTPADILVWKPTLEHVDVLSDTAATWTVVGVITNPAWIWSAALAEGSQEQQTLVRIGSADPEVNQNAETYQYLAFSDPGQRFMLNGAIVKADVNVGTADALIDTKFLPQFLFFIDTRPGNDLNLISGVKGPGHPAGVVSLIDAGGTNRATALDMALGSITLGAALNFTTDIHLAYSAWRDNDGSNDPGIPKVVKIGSYIGDGGAGDRTIPLSPASLVRPLWALVAPDGARAFVRDPSHAGTNATGIDGTGSAVAIKGGAVDGIKVGTALNANGTLYNYFVIMGSATGNADGWSINGEFVPVEPTSPTGSQWGADPELVSTVDEAVGADAPGVPGGGADDMDTDLDANCLPFTTRVINIALSRIGISQRISNMLTDTGQPALVARTNFAQDLKATLRDHPWPFATRWAALTLLQGSVAAPVNRDWTYSYARPSDCVFERRIATTRDGAVDPTAPPFQLSFDNTLDTERILTNQPAAWLEYTARPECSAAVGDPLFREAFIWKLAGSLGGPLTRITDVVKHCSDQYDIALEKARQVIRPGNPGPRQTIDALALDPGTDVDAAAGLHANIVVVNRGLIRIGARTIANLADEQSKEANAARLIFEEELQTVLRDHPWAFATAYVVATLIGGTTGTPYNDDWQYAYAYPANAVEIRRIVKPTSRRGFDRYPELFRVGNNASGRIIFSNWPAATFEYTKRIENCVLYAEPLFRDAFAWRLAGALAPSLAQIDPDVPEAIGRGPVDRPRERKATEAGLRARAAETALRMYGFVVRQAQAADLNEQQSDTDRGNADWILERN